MHGSFLLEIIYLLLAAVIFVPIAQAIRLGAVPGFLLAGILIGPGVLGLVHDVENIAHISEFGVVLLLFVIGMEMKPAFLWRIRHLVFGLGSAQILLCTAIITSFCYFVINLSWPTSVVIGTALSLSSTAFVLQILTDKKQLTTDTGKPSVAILLMQDLAVVPLLALIPMLAATNSVTSSVSSAFLQSVGILVAVFLGGRYLLAPLLHRVALSANAEVFTALAVLIVLGTAYLTELAGLSMAMGAFLAGLLISDSSYRHQIKAEIQPFRGLLLGAFFVAMGMSLNISGLINNPGIILFATLGLIAVKVAVITPLARLFGLPWHKALSVGLLLGQGGEFALVLFTLAFNQSILAQPIFDKLMLVVLVSMLVTPVLAYFADVLKAKPQDDTDLNTVEAEQSEGKVVIAGFGRVGRAVAQVLDSANISYMAFDKSANIVKAYQQEHPIFFGDVTQTSLLHAGGIQHASCVIITVNSPEDAKELVSTLHHAHPSLPLYVRGHNSDTCKALYQLGATRVISENIEVSLELSEQVLDDHGVDSLLQNQLLTAFRENYYKKIKDPTDTIMN